MTPEVIECSWLAERELVGRGRVEITDMQGNVIDSVMGMWQQGGVYFIDGGTLDFGIVRDSTLNSTNDFQVFGESFRVAAGASTTGQPLFTVDLRD